MIIDLFFALCIPPTSSPVTLCIQLVTFKDNIKMHFGACQLKKDVNICWSVVSTEFKQDQWIDWCASVNCLLSLNVSIDLFFDFASVIF